MFAEGIFPVAYPWGIWARTPAVVIQIEWAVLPYIYRATPDLRTEIDATIAEYLLMLADRVEDDTQPLEVRLSRHLIRHAEQEGDGKPRVNGFSQEAIAQHTSLSRESINKGVDNLVNQGVIRGDHHTGRRNGITIGNIKRLHEIAGG